MGLLGWKFIPLATPHESRTFLKQNFGKNSWGRRALPPLQLMELRGAQNQNWNSFLWCWSRYLVGHSVVQESLKGKPQIHKVLMIILQKSFSVSHIPHFPAGLDWQGIHPCSECVRKPLYPREWKSTMQEEPFLRAQPRRQWLHQLLGHKELLVSGTLPRFFGTKEHEGFSKHVLACGEKRKWWAWEELPGDRSVFRGHRTSRGVDRSRAGPRAVFTKEQMGVIPTRDKQGNSASPEPFANQTVFAQNGGILGVREKLVSGLVLVSIEGDGSWDVTVRAESMKAMGRSCSKIPS